MMPTAISSPTSVSPLQPSRKANATMAKFGDVGVHQAGGEKKRVVSALAVQAGLKRGKRLSAVMPNAPVVSMEVMNNNFEEWMKLATDNKITATNTWNFALIDYFADLTLLRNGPDDQSINFQKASATLDGCVKVWTSRVDSVATETGRLLSGLAGGGGAEEPRDEGEEGDEEEPGAENPVKRKTTHRSEATLAKSFAALQVKKFDLEFTVDPLFKKTCADFDEGGAMGLLMNHLGVDGKGRVVFDAGDAGVEEEDEVAQEEEEMVDLAKLREFIPSLDQARELNISDTLSSFRFAADPNSMPDFSTLVGLRDSFDDEPRPMADFEGTPPPSGEAQDFFGDEDFDIGGPAGYDDAGSIGGDEEAVAGEHSRGAVGMVAPGDSHAPFDPRRQGGELVMALVGGPEEEEMFDYFDRGLGKAWAGAEHWKLKKVSRKDTATAAATKGPKTAKTPFQIDFLSPSAAQSSKTLFASAPRSSLALPSSSKGPRRSSKKNDAKKRRDEWLLPDDMHFSSRQLLRLFLKPKFSLRVRRNTSAARMAENADGEIDENFWAQAAADRADLPDDPDDIDSAPIPFESQFFHDDVDDAFVDDTLGGPVTNGDGDAGDLWQGTQGQELKKSRPENVNFAKKAKRVDVKRLKDDIWSGLRTLVPDEKGSDGEMLPRTPNEEAPVRTFDTVIQDLRTTYPTDKMSEISTSFCFICLLHLANEEGLQIETARFDGRDGDEGCVGEFKGVLEDESGLVEGRRLDGGDRRDRVVGELQALRVWKDPNAGRAA